MAHLQVGDGAKGNDYRLGDAAGGSFQHLGLVNSGLNRKTPWYSEAYGDLIKSTAKLPWGNGDLVNRLKMSRTVDFDIIS